MIFQDQDQDRLSWSPLIKLYLAVLVLRPTGHNTSSVGTKIQKDMTLQAVYLDSTWIPPEKKMLQSGKQEGRRVTCQQFIL